MFTMGLTYQLRRPLRIHSRLSSTTPLQYQNLMQHRQLEGMRGSCRGPWLRQEGSFFGSVPVWYCGKALPGESGGCVVTRALSVVLPVLGRANQIARRNQYNPAFVWYCRGRVPRLLEISFLILLKRSFFKA